MQFAGPYQSFQSPYRQPISDEIRMWFDAVDENRSGRISYRELQAALITDGGRMFSDKACQLMIAMFDNDRSGKIDIHEFQALFGFVNQSMNVFRRFDADNSGYIDRRELTPVLHSLGYTFSPDFVNLLVTNPYNTKPGQLSSDEFIIICVQIQRLTDAFRKYDKEHNGTAVFNFEEFIDAALKFVVWK